MYVTGDFDSDRDGFEIAYGLEGTGEVGPLNGKLQTLWKTTVNGRNAASQITAADIDGDETLEILTNTDEDASSGLTVLKPDGSVLGTEKGVG